MIIIYSIKIKFIFSFCLFGMLNWFYKFDTLPLKNSVYNCWFISSYFILYIFKIDTKDYEYQEKNKIVSYDYKNQIINCGSQINIKKL